MENQSCYAKPERQAEEKVDTTGSTSDYLVGGISTHLKNTKISWDHYSQLNGKITTVPNHLRVNQSLLYQSKYSIVENSDLYKSFL